MRTPAALPERSQVASATSVHGLLFYGLATKRQFVRRRVVCSSSFLARLTFPTAEWPVVASRQYSGARSRASRTAEERIVLLLGAAVAAYPAWLVARHGPRCDDFPHLRVVFSKNPSQALTLWSTRARESLSRADPYGGLIARGA